MEEKRSGDLGARPVLIVKAGSTLPEVKAVRGDFEAWISNGLALPEFLRIKTAAIFKGESLPDPVDLSGVVVTGSPAMVSDREPWSENAVAWLRQVLDADVPCLGICYGHQLLARAAGADVGRNPRGRQIGTVEVRMRGQLENPLFSVLPDRAFVQATHLESVLGPPPGATIYGTTPLDPYHAFALRKYAFGVQFHPEFDAQIMCAYIDGRREILREENLEPEALRQAVQTTPLGGALLRRFGELIATNA